MRRISASLLFLAATVTFAQTAAQKTPATPGDITFRFPVSATGCPVGFNASRRGGLQALTAAEDKKLGPGQGLHLNLDHLTNPAIQSITVTVYATSPDARSCRSTPPPQIPSPKPSPSNVNPAPPLLMRPISGCSR